MTNLNEKLVLSEEIQSLLNEIEATPLYYTEAKLEDHPDFPEHSRYLRVLGIDTKSYNQFAIIFYVQIGKHKETGEEWALPLKCPEFVIYKETSSYLKDNDNNIIEAENSDTGLMEKVRVPSFKYMVYLSKHNVSLTSLLAGFLPAFIISAGDELNEKTQPF